MASAMTNYPMWGQAPVPLTWAPRSWPEEALARGHPVSLSPEDLVSSFGPEEPGFWSLQSTHPLQTLLHPGLAERRGLELASLHL